MAGPSSAAAEFPAGTDVFVDVVNTTGVEDGSEANPFNTIQEGVNGASNGDVVGVAPGTYTEEVTVKSGVSIIGSDRDTTIIDGGGDDGSGVKIEQIANVRGSGFTIKGADSGGSTFTGSGVFVNNWSSDVKVDNNILTDNDFGVGTANAFLSTGPTEITGNFILNNRFHGISGAGGTLIANNIIAFNDFSGISNGGTSSAYSVINNTIIGNKQEGINTWDDRVSTTMNNIVSDNGGFGINVRTANNPTAKRPIVTANLFFTNADRNFSDIDAPVGSDATLNSAAEINSISEDGTSEFDIGADEFEPPPKCNGLRPTIIGTEGDDILIGSSRADVIRGLGVNDVIKGKGGDDTICAGPGEDAVSGGLGDDWISGEAGPDSINGGAPAKTR